MSQYDQQKILKKKWEIKDKGGHIRIKSVRCGKSNCSKCPHDFYAYLVHTFFGKQEWRYLGKCDRLGRPIPRPKDDLRPIYKDN